MNGKAPTPLVGVPACRKRIDTHWFHTVGEKYVHAITDAALAVPVLLPAIGEDVHGLLSGLDGLFLTGSLSNVLPHHYDGEPSEPGTLHDEHRDATTLPLIRQAVREGLPVLAVCRGLQEMNVAYGGTLHQGVHEVAGKRDHREDTQAGKDVQYGPAHTVRLAADGQLRGLAGSDEVTVNSLHSQGVDRLGEGLSVEATADDGLVEAFRVTDASTFALAVQWHPEWQTLSNPFSTALFRSFGDACAERARNRR